MFLCGLGVVLVFALVFLNGLDGEKNREHNDEVYVSDEIAKSDTNEEDIEYKNSEQESYPTAHCIVDEKDILFRSRSITEWRKCMSNKYGYYGSRVMMNVMPGDILIIKDDVIVSNNIVDWDEARCYIFETQFIGHHLLNDGVKYPYDIIGHGGMFQYMNLNKDMTVEEVCVLGIELLLKHNRITIIPKGTHVQVVELENLALRNTPLVKVRFDNHSTLYYVPYDFLIKK
jgi:hypothetical protein